MPTAGLPRPQAAIADRTGLPTREWYSYFLQLRDGGGLTPAQQQQLDELAARVTALEDGGAGGGTIQGIGSIAIQGAPPGVMQISLEGDTDTPGNTWYYGTGPDGTRGWYALADGFAVTTNLTKIVDGTTGITTFGLADLANSGVGALMAITRDAKGLVSGTRLATITGTAGQIDVANGTAAAGLPTISLADLANSGVGASLAKFTRDAKGRISGTSAATTDDLPESGTPTNQWFTAARVRAVVLTGLSTATNAVIAATDSILVALGKLQAQVTARALDADVVKLTGDQTIAGLKTFSSRATVLAGTNSIFLARTVGGIDMLFAANDTNGTGYIGTGSNTPFSLYTNNLSRMRFLAAGNIEAGADNTQSFGSAAARWSVIYAGTGTINTSDAREKTTVTSLSDNELACSIQLGREIGWFQFHDAISTKGADARQHVGMTVQRAIEVMQQHGLNPFRWGFICHDEWDAQEQIEDEDREVIQEARAAGDRYSFREGELHAFIIRGLVQRQDDLEARILTLESGSPDSTPG